MAEDIKQRQFEKKIKGMMSSLSSIQTEGIKLEEARLKLIELFQGIQGRNIDHDLDMNYLCSDFKKWLIDEKNISEDRATEISLPLNMLSLEQSVEQIRKLENIEKGDKAEILLFPGKSK
jgi:hypothetical protein